MKNLDNIDIMQNVSDFAGIIEKDYTEKIDRSIKSIEDISSVEIAIVTVRSLEGRPIDEVALELFNKFGIGKKDDDNGILLLVSKDENEFRIEIGIGLEKILSDRFNDDLANKVISPGFSKKKFGPSILKFVKKISSRIRAKGFSNLSIVSWLSGILSLIFGLAGIFSSSVLTLTGNIDVNRMSSLMLLFLKTTSPAVAFSLIAIICGTLDLIRQEDYLGSERYSSRSITGIVLGVAALLMVTIIFFIFPSFILFLAKAFSLSSGSY
ncbi:MAG: TPM domain-containing protein [Actinobacteria bacterium]|nr:TPM domain-containing protein [Actinomycetota bacterium]